MRKKIDKKSEIIGCRAKQLRLSKGLTQMEIAEKLKLSPQHYGTLERGINSFSLETIIELCEIYQIPLMSMLVDLTSNDKKRERDLEKITLQINELSVDHKETILHLIEYFKSKEKIVLRDQETKKKIRENKKKIL